jgi:hypothetical protein
MYVYHRECRQNSHVCSAKKSATEEIRDGCSEQNKREGYGGYGGPAGIHKGETRQLEWD